ncbi:MAG: hypothetical protein NDI69_09730 [Bacteriovoracaceae bacterium]|nr:hypothetical protein [Bacteriovoracaceae bacterium]
MSHKLLQLHLDQNKRLDVWNQIVGPKNNYLQEDTIDWVKLLSGKAHLGFVTNN